MKSMGERLKALVADSNYSVEELAETIGVTKNTIYNIFKGSDPKTSVINRLAKELNTSVDYIVLGHEHDKDKIEADILNKFRELDYEYKILISKQITELWIEQNSPKQKD